MSKLTDLKLLLDIAKTGHELWVSVRDRRKREPQPAPEKEKKERVPGPYSGT